MRQDHKETNRRKRKLRLKKRYRKIQRSLKKIKAIRHFFKHYVQKTHQISVGS